MLIGVVISGLAEDYTMNICSGIEYMAKDKDVKIVVIPIKYIGVDYELNFGKKYTYCYNSLLAYSILSAFDGLIVEVASVAINANNEIKDKYIKYFDNIPHVFVSYDVEGHSSVLFDNKAGLDAALEYMYKNGARKYAMFCGPKNNVDAIERRNCFESFMKKHDLQCEPKQFVHGSFFLESGKEALELYTNNSDADVFVCANDFLAKTMYEACKKNNAIPGKDVSILGFDDSDVCINSYPSISSIRTDLVEVGQKSFSLLMDVIKRKKKRKELVPSKFILRDSVLHREKNIDLTKSKLAFQDILKANVNAKDDVFLEKISGDFEKIFQMISAENNQDFNKLIANVNKVIDSVFFSGYLKFFDFELFVDLIATRFEGYIENIDEDKVKVVVSKIYAELMKKMLKYSQCIDESRTNKNMDYLLGMEAFYRESMQFNGNSEANFVRFFENLEFLGIKNAYLYMYEKPILYMQNDYFVIPKNLYLKAVLSDGKTYNVPKSRQKIKKENFFDNAYVSWNGYERLTIFPVYIDNYLYGVILCDIKRIGYDKADMFTNQISGAIKMLMLRNENNRIMNEYEESVRKLKDNNITLENMSKTDPLTGLNNRRGFYSKAEGMLKSYPTDKVSLLVGYVDMNDLKIVNDRFGHDDGDYSLRSIGVVLTDFVAENKGFAARIGGDEFAFMLPINADSSLDIYRSKLISLFDDFNKASEKEYNISVSIGLNLINMGDNISIEDALNFADEQLYSEKTKKGNLLKKKGLSMF